MVSIHCTVFCGCCRKARLKVGRDTLLKAARSPVKTVLQDEKTSEPKP